MADIKLIDHRISGRNVSSPDKLFSAAKRELWPTVEAVLRKLNDEIIPAVNGLSDGGIELIFEAGGSLTVDQACEVVTYGNAAVVRNPRWIHHGYYSSGSGEFMNLRGSETDRRPFTTFATGMMMDRAGRLVSVRIVHSTSTALTVGLYLNLDSVTPVREVTVTSSDNVKVFDFEQAGGAEWSAGDIIGIKVPSPGFISPVPAFLELEMDGL